MEATQNARSTFTHATLAKRTVQLDMYTQLGDRYNSVLILPGRAPGFEIGCIKVYAPTATITAVDRDATAVNAASSAGATLAIHDDIATLQFERKFDFVNLDLCTNKFEPFVHMAELTQHYLAVCVMVGRRYLTAKLHSNPTLPQGASRTLQHLCDLLPKFKPLCVYTYIGTNGAAMLYVIFSRYAQDLSWAPFHIRIRNQRNMQGVL